jgi:hypothetical protein
MASSWCAGCRCEAECGETLVRQDEKLAVSCDRKAQSNLQRLRLDAAEDVKHSGKQFLVRLASSASSQRFSMCTEIALWRRESCTTTMKPQLPVSPQPTCQLAPTSYLALGAAVQGADQVGQRRLCRLSAASERGFCNRGNTYSQRHRCAVDNCCSAARFVF